MRNTFGLDVGYFRNWLQRVERDLTNYRPDELSRELARMAHTADGNEAGAEIERLRESGDA